MVRDEVGDGQVVFVADAADDGDARGEDGLGDRLLVEGPEVFEAAAAAADDHHIDDGSARRVQLVDAANGVGDVLRRPVALHLDRADPHFGGRPAARQDLQHVAHGGAGGAGDQHDAARDARQLLLAGRIEEALSEQLLLELAEGEFQRADALGLHFLNLQLVIAARQIDREPAADDDAHSVLQVETHAQADAAPDHGPQGSFFVFQRKIQMAGVRAGQVRHLALDPDGGVFLFQKALNGARQFADREDLDRRRRDDGADEINPDDLPMKPR